MKRYIKKIYKQIKDVIRPSLILPQRLVISKAQWMNNAQSPVIFMIDDLTNAWYDRNGNGEMDIGEDWGAGLDKDGSALNFLEKYLLKSFPYIKTTFLTTIGSFQSFSSKVPFTYAAPINATLSSSAFFRKLSFSNRYELGYHGLHHGIIDENNAFLQEWESFRSVDEALKTIAEAKQIFKNTTGMYPLGGKYCGYRDNHFSDISIEKSGFLWWCRDWTPIDIDKQIDSGYYNMNFFGENAFVVSVPANVRGNMWLKAQIKRLLEERLPISIQEHIAPYKTNGRIQTPNIIDDIEELKKLFSFLKGKNVWYGTPSEAASYFLAREKSIIYDVDIDSFKIIYQGNIPNPILTLNIDARCLCNNQKTFLHITIPSGVEVAQQQFIEQNHNLQFTVNLPIQNGIYRLKALSTPPETMTATMNKNFEICYSHENLAGFVHIESEPNMEYLYKNKVGQATMAKRVNYNQVTFFCESSTSGDKLIPFKT